MKLKLFTLLLAIAASIGTMQASDTQVDGIWYDFDSSTKTASVTFRGDTADYDNEYTGSVVIPASVTYNSVKYSVTSIGGYAFYGSSGLTSVTIPGSVTSIGDFAFSSCSSLTSMTIPNSVTSIEYGAFSGCSGLTSIIVESGNTVYDSRANCNAIIETATNTLVAGCQSTIIPNSVTSIGNYAFLNCTGLTSVTIPNSVTSIGNYAFLDCTGLTSVTIGNSVTSIGNLAFEFCRGLTSVEIPNSVTSIGGGAFLYCTGLTSVTIPNSVTSIGSLAFDYCSSLTSITCEATTPPTLESDVFSYVDKSIPLYVPAGSIDLYKAANQWKDFTNILPIGETPAPCITASGTCGAQGDNLTWELSCDSILTISGIGEMANYSNVPSVPWYSYRSSIQYVVIGNSVTSIGDETFSNCSGLTSVTIPNSVTSIGDSAFHACTGLTSVIWDAKNCSTSGDFGSQVTSFVFGNEVETIPADCCSGMNITSITIPNSVTSIGDYAFAWCTGLTAVTIPNSVTSIGDYAFYKCTGLTSPVYNAHVFAFMPTSYSGAYTIPDGIESIGDGAFQNCTGLTSVTIPNSVTSIGYKAFSDCSSLTAIYVPCGEMERFKQMLNNDSRINDHAPLPYTITINEEHGNVTYPQTMCDDMSLNATPDYGYHFVQWSDGNTDNPRTIVMTQDTTFTAEFAPDRVGTCGKDMALVWSYDPTNKVLTIGNAGSFTENMQFGAEAPNEMEELVIGNSVTAIGANAFAGIETLKKITIGESVKTIGEQAFYNCVNLETIFNYRPTPTNTYSNTFDGVDKFECTLYVLPNSIDMYKNAAVWRDFYYTYAIGAEETTVTTNDVTVEPQDNAVTLTWPTSNNAASYTIQITKDGVLFCTLIFNANGQLTGIAFAPGREGQAHAPAALMTANGLQFTVTGLDSGTQYGYSVTAKDSNDQPVATYSGEFTTTSESIATGIDNIDSSSLQGGDRGRLILHNGQIYILRGEKVYTLTGAEVK